MTRFPPFFVPWCSPSLSFFFSLPCILTGFSCVSTSCMSSSARKKASWSTCGRGVRQGCLCQRFVSYYCWISDRFSGPAPLARLSHTQPWWMGGLWNAISIVRFVWLDWVGSLSLDPITPPLKSWCHSLLQSLVHARSSSLTSCSEYMASPYVCRKVKS